MTPMAAVPSGGVRACRACNRLMVTWHGTWLCTQCDSRGDLQPACWEVAWAHAQSEDET